MDGFGLNSLEKKERGKKGKRTTEKKAVRKDWALNGKEEAGAGKRWSECFSLPLEGSVTAREVEAWCQKLSTLRTDNQS